MISVCMLQTKHAYQSTTNSPPSTINFTLKPILSQNPDRWSRWKKSPFFLCQNFWDFLQAVIDWCFCLCFLLKGILCSHFLLLCNSLFYFYFFMKMGYMCAQQPLQGELLQRCQQLQSRLSTLRIENEEANMHTHSHIHTRECIDTDSSVFSSIANSLVSEYIYSIVTLNVLLTLSVHARTFHLLT